MEAWDTEWGHMRLSPRMMPQLCMMHADCNADTSNSKH